MTEVDDGEICLKELSTLCFRISKKQLPWAFRQISLIVPNLKKYSSQS